MEIAHSFRLVLKKALASKNPQKPTDGTIWIAKTFPPWQSCVLDTMRDLYEVSRELSTVILMFNNCIIIF